MILKNILASTLIIAAAAALSLTAEAADKVYVCHLTSSDSNPVVMIYISENAVPAQLDKGDYILPAGQTSCSTPVPPPEEPPAPF